MRKLIVIVLCLVCSQNIWAVTKTWTGAVSNNWNTAGNWSPSGVPATGDDIIIGPIATGNNHPTRTGALTIGNWNTGSLTVKDNAVLSVTGNITITGGNGVDGIILSSGGVLNHTGTDFSLPYVSTVCINISGGKLITNAEDFLITGKMTMSSGEFIANDGFAVASGKEFVATGGIIRINGHLDIKSSNSKFYAGSDSLIVNGRLTLGSSCNFYGGSAKIVINRTGNGNNTNNQISGDWYTQNATVTFNPYMPLNGKLTSISSSGASFNANQGTVIFNDSVYIGSNASLNGDSGTVTFSKSLVVSGSGFVNNDIGTLNFEGDATFSNSGTFNTGSGEINVGGDVNFYSSGVINNTSATINVTGDANFHNSGTLNAGSGELNVGGNVTFEGNGGTINAQTSTITIGGDFNNLGTFNCDSSMVILAGANSQMISTDVTFFNLQIQTNGTLNAGGNVTVLNNGTIGTQTQISIPDDNDQFEVNGDLVDSSGSLAVATNKPFVTAIQVISTTEIIVIFNETVTIASAENAANSTWTGRTISGRTRIDSNKLRLSFTPAIVKDVEYTLVFQNIQNVRNPAGTMSAGHEKRFTWGTPATPATASSNLSFSDILGSSFSLAWTKGSGTSRLVIARADSPVNFTPSNDTEYAANDTFGEGTDLGNGNYAVYSGTGSGFSLKGLTAGKTYYFAIYEFNGSGINLVYQTTNPLTGSQGTGFAAPTVQASNLLIAGSSDSSITLSWTVGNGSSRIVLARASSSVNTLPTDGNTYTANSTFGEGSEIGSNNYVVYKGSGNTITVTGLENNRRYFFTVLEFNGSAGAENYYTQDTPELSTHTYIKVDIKVFLEGPFDSATQRMKTVLTANLPDSQVYNTAPWNYAGMEAVENMPDSVVDWVLVEMRQASLPNQAVDTNVVGRRAGLLLSNGKIVDTDGVSPLMIPTNRAGRMYAVVYHRTHIPVQSADSLSRSAGRYTYDFTTNVNGAYGNSNPLKELSSGIYGMYCGRVATNTTDSIGVSDRVAAWNERNTLGYHPADVNLDGVVDAEDRSIIWNNYGVEKEVAE